MRFARQEPILLASPLGRPRPPARPVNSSTGSPSRYDATSALTGDAIASLLAIAAADAIVAIDAESRIKALNPAAERLFGGTSADLLGRALTELMPPEFAPLHEAGLARYLTSGVRRLSWEAADAVIQRFDTRAHVPVTISFADHHVGELRLFVAVLRNRTE